MRRSHLAGARGGVGVDLKRPLKIDPVKEEFYRRPGSQSVALASLARLESVKVVSKPDAGRRTPRALEACAREDVQEPAREIGGG